MSTDTVYAHPYIRVHFKVIQISNLQLKVTDYAHLYEYNSYIFSLLCFISDIIIESQLILYVYTSKIYIYSHSHLYIL